MTNIVVPVHEGARVRGRLVASRDVNDVDFSGFPIAVRSLDGWNLAGLPLGRTNRDGTFASAALPPGRYTILPQAVGDYRADSVVVRGRESIGTGVEVTGVDLDDVTITITQVRTIVTGAVRDRTGKSRPDARVLAFRVDGAWREGLFGGSGGDATADRTDRFGRYELRLGPGEYFITAVEGRLPIVWRAPELLQALIPLATKVSLTRGMRLTADLTVQPAPKPRP